MQGAAPVDPSSEPTGNTCLVLHEVYETPAGLEDHWQQAAEGFADFSAFLAWTENVTVTVLHDSPVVHSLW